MRLLRSQYEKKKRNRVTFFFFSSYLALEKKKELYNASKNTDGARWRGCGVFLRNDFVCGAKSGLSPAVLPSECAASARLLKLLALLSHAMLVAPPGR